MSKKPMTVRRSRGAKSEQAQVEKLYKQIHQTKIVFERWIAGPEATISTSAAGVVALATIANAASISGGCPDFPSLAALYTAYRCKAIRAQLLPYVPVPYYNGAAAITAPGAIAVFPWTSNTVPTTFQQAMDVTGVKLVSGYKQLTISTSYKGDPDAHLWTGTGAAIGSNEQFGISCIGTASPATVSQAIWKVLPQYLVEFRMAG